ncbi:copper homeostasis protein cutC homolog isoform X2 [Malaya genurostris]|uniref:copper homeostasis protein cutC homolog isoform X2 n=1 Tax=Malaya genurostris TaxID=325434 RepID=UPI0026F3D1A1|nr:copper homeostasis protein cutC homolog isoform X2 [Malaya genurostris]
MPPLLEICVDSFESAVAAVRGGADRLEVCAALSEGGLTPSVGLLSEIKCFIQKNNHRTKLYAMIRCRQGSDFCYSEPEMNAMVHDLKLLAHDGADGFVFGALTDDGNIHADQCRMIVTAAQTFGLSITFHRAFDCTEVGRMAENLKLVASLGFSTILTSGFERTAVEGLQNVVQLVNIAEQIREQGTKMVIMPGSGVTTENAQNIVQTTKCCAIHASARSLKKTDPVCALPMGSVSTVGDGLLVCDENIVRLIKIQIATEVI